MERNNVAFVYYETIEQCTEALERMRGRAVENGVVLALNYGNVRTPGRLELDANGLPVGEAPTNVIYFGQLPANTEVSDLEKLLSPFEGFISAKYVASNNIGFGHFYTWEHAKVARLALHDATVKGAPIRVSFGKQNHNLTPEEIAAATGGSGGLDLDAMMQTDPDHHNIGGSGVVALSNGGGGGALTLPAMGGPAPQEANANSIFKREREAPTVDLEAELRTLLGCMYNSCGAKDAELGRVQLMPLCSRVDQCVDSETEKELTETIKLYTPTYSVHVFNTIAKRMAEFFDDDLHKKLLITYATTRALLSTKIEQTYFNEAALNSFLMVLLVASHGQAGAGADRLHSIIEYLLPHRFLDEKVKATDDYRASFREQLTKMQTNMKAQQDLASLLTRRRRN
ncbi:RNA-binding protein [Angomonas deanei]|uniref:RRM domain-containing protein n=1 Tax=Angomonas deanei TaxID=59799 RepID=A0A7G2CJH5_9TRYP|nr:RNA-binding protein [Angomonas deanei]CAD2218753.1 hypothetical protein, conserved [Angomonas deanei]|eukprot:EPY36940.1 RNA-binding protein [Angomonas deanei]